MWILDSFGSPNFSSHGEAKVTELSRLQTEICEGTYMCVCIYNIYTHVVVMQNVYNVCMYMNMLYIYIHTHTHTHTPERIHSAQCQTKFGEARTRLPAELERDCLIRDLCAMPGFTGCFFVIFCVVFVSGFGHWAFQSCRICRHTVLAFSGVSGRADKGFTWLSK